MRSENEQNWILLPYEWFFSEVTLRSLPRVSEGSTTYPDGPGYAVGVKTHYELEGPGIEFRW
jgi:hypothetical protein